MNWFKYVWMPMTHKNQTTVYPHFSYQKFAYINSISVYEIILSMKILEIPNCLFFLYIQWERKKVKIPLVMKKKKSYIARVNSFWCAPAIKTPKWKHELAQAKLWLWNERSFLFLRQTHIERLREEEIDLSDQWISIKNWKRQYQYLWFFNCRNKCHFIW